MKKRKKVEGRVFLYKKFEHLSILVKSLISIILVSKILIQFSKAQYDTVTINFNPPFSSGTTGTWQEQSFQVNASSLVHAPGTAPYVFQDLVYTLKSIFVKAEHSLPYLQLQIKAPGGHWMSIIDEFGNNRTAQGTNMHMETWFISRHYGGGNPRPSKMYDNQAADCEGGSPWNIGVYGCGKALPPTGGTGTNYDGDFRLLETWGCNIAGTWYVRIRNWSGINSGYTATSNPPRLVQLKLVFGPTYPAHTGVGGDNCSTAFEITTLGIYSNNTSNFTGGPSEDPRLSGVNPCSWNSSFDNSAWYSFIAQTDSLDFILSGVNCTGGNQKMQVIVVTGTPGDPNPCALNGMTGSYWELNPVVGGCPTDYYGGVVSSAGYCNGRAVNIEFHLRNLIPGKRYFIVIDGNAGANCDFILDITSGLPSPSPICSVSAGNDTTICPGQTLTVNADTLNCTSVQWSTSGDGTFSNTNVINPTYIPGNNDISNGFVYLTVTANSPCGIRKDSIKVTIISSSNVSAGNDTSICAGSTVTLTASQGTSYIWSTGQTTQSITVNPTTTTTYSVTVFNGVCWGTADVVVSIVNAPNVTISPSNPTICPGGQVTLTAQGATNFIWSPTTSLNNSNGSTVIASPSQTTVYTVTASVGANCVNTATVTVTVENLHVSISTTTDSVCYGNSATLTATGALSYQWAPSMWISSTSGNTVTVTPQTTQTYTVTGYSALNCSSTSQIKITVLPLPDFSITATPNKICYGDTSILSVSNNSYNYTWTPSNSLSSTIGTSVVATPTSTITYSVTATDIFSCKATNSITLQVLPLPILNISANSNIVCKGNNAIITASGAQSYSWSSSSSLAYTGQIIQVPIQNTTTFTVTGTDLNGCKDTETITINIYDNIDITLYASKDTICYGQTTFLNVNFINNGGGSPYSYNWSSIPGTINPPLSVTPLETTTYSITVTDRCNTIDSAKITIHVLPLPNPDFEAYPNKNCGSLKAKFNSLNNHNIIQWLWDFGDPKSGNQNISNLQNPQHTYQTTGYYDVSLTVTDIYGCSNTIVKDNYISVYPNITADFYFEPQEASEFEPYFEFYDKSNNAISWLWNFGDSPAGYSTLQNPTYVYSTYGEFEVSLNVSNIYGCRDSVKKKLKVKPETAWYIPNAFHPNGNDRNELFGLWGWGIKNENFEMYIYNRWGELLFFSDDLNKRWDGRYNGSFVPSGIYVYLIKFYANDNKYHTLSGWVLVLDANEYR